MESKYSKFLTILLIIIIIGVIGLLGYLGYSFLKDRTIDQEAAEFVQSFTDTTEKKYTPSNSNSTTSENSVLNENYTEIEEVNTTVSSSSKKKTYKGFNALGTIEIPKTDVSYPILEAARARKALEVAVVALYPQNPVLNSKGNVVIIGHNYRNGKFFSNNKNLSNGDKIYITDLDGNKITYIIYKIFQTDESDTSFYNRDTNGSREITLSTCTDDSTARTIILAKAQGD